VTYRHRRLLTTPLAVVLPLLLTIACGGCDSGASFTLEFPATVSLGTLSMIEDVNCFTCGTGRRDLGAASGRVHVQLPAPHWYVSLKMPREASRLMPYLMNPSLADIGDLDLQGSDVTDADLRYVAGLHLRSIELSHTRITGSGLEHVHEHPRWTWVDLQGCPRLDVESLAHFRGWKRATIRLLPYVSSGESYSDAERGLLEGARHVICADQPEDVCGTQIR
jgi:hypothetical protein